MIVSGLVADTVCADADGAADTVSAAAVAKTTAFAPSIIPIPGCHVYNDEWSDQRVSMPSQIVPKETDLRNNLLFFVGCASLQKRGVMLLAIAALLA
ncbi:hypothetical protein [Blastomonas aquatica]|uniref:Uncharacterized protein n=1 Tax=Blastomonas aquatica TaxID=1510276 RepID=A0ABQ1JER6_9SPHN|nr:hypothetical protein [Blastomonas aquatica]GGB66716.1 hypothetical protein GCM10010833_22380 [Blastomonas aquatica]